METSGNPLWNKTHLSLRVFAAHSYSVYSLSRYPIWWAARTLKERCVLFHRRFPEVSISKSNLQKIYKENKMKRRD